MSLQSSKILMSKRNVLRVVPRVREKSTLKERIAEKIHTAGEKMKELRKESGRKPVCEVTVNDLYGGIQGILGIMCETSTLNPNEGVRFRGLTIPELTQKLPKAKDGEQPLPEGLFWLLMTGEVPTQEQVLQLTCEWAERSELPEHIDHLLKNIPPSLHPIYQLSCATSALSLCSEFAKAYARGVERQAYWEYTYEDAMNYIAKLPRIAARIYRHTYHEGVPACSDFKDDLDWSARYANMLGYGDSRFIELLRLYLTIHSDHGGANVSSHTSHLVGSALSDPYMAYSAGINALSGHLHGYAHQEVLKWLEELQEKVGSEPTEEQVRQYCEETLENGKTIPGYGHPVLRVEDPRWTWKVQFAEKHLPPTPLTKLALTVSKVAPCILRTYNTGNPWPNAHANAYLLFTPFGLDKPDYYPVLFSTSRALGIMSSLTWQRALMSPTERPSSITTGALMEMFKKDKNAGEDAQGKYCNHGNRPAAEAKDGKGKVTEGKIIRKPICSDPRKHVAHHPQQAKDKNSEYSGDGEVIRRPIIRKPICSDPRKHVAHHPHQAKDKNSKYSGDGEVIRRPVCTDPCNQKAQYCQQAKDQTSRCPGDGNYIKKPICTDPRKQKTQDPQRAKNQKSKCSGNSKCGTRKDTKKCLCGNKGKQKKQDAQQPENQKSKCSGFGKRIKPTCGNKGKQKTQGLQQNKNEKSRCTGHGKTAKKSICGQQKKQDTEKAKNQKPKSPGFGKAKNQKPKSPGFGKDAKKSVCRNQGQQKKWNLQQANSKKSKCPAGEKTAKKSVCGQKKWEPQQTKSEESKCPGRGKTAKESVCGDQGQQEKWYAQQTESEKYKSLRGGKVAKKSVCDDHGIQEPQEAQDEKCKCPTDSKGGDGKAAKIVCGDQKEAKDGKGKAGDSSKCGQIQERKSTEDAKAKKGQASKCGAIEEQQAKDNSGKGKASICARDGEDNAEGNVVKPKRCEEENEKAGTNPKENAASKVGACKKAKCPKSRRATNRKALKCGVRMKKKRVTCGVQKKKCKCEKNGKPGK